MSVSKDSLKAFSHPTETETFSSVEMICCSSASMLFRKSSISLFLLMQPNALLISSIIWCTDSFFAVIVLSISVKICSIIDQFGLKAARDGSISASSLSLILLVMHAVRMLQREERLITGLRFDGEQLKSFQNPICYFPWRITCV